jgi:hypothetical protein
MLSMSPYVFTSSHANAPTTVSRGNSGFEAQQRNSCCVCRSGDVPLMCRNDKSCKQASRHASKQAIQYTKHTPVLRCVLTLTRGNGNIWSCKHAGKQGAGTQARSTIAVELMQSWLIASVVGPTDTLQPQLRANSPLPHLLLYALSYVHTWV